MLDRLAVCVGEDENIVFSRLADRPERKEKREERRLGAIARSFYGCSDAPVV
jgi:hypothetical protein